MSLSVVIPFFNANDTLDLQLEALAHQVDAGAFEVIVVDNRSTESPQSVVDKWRSMLNIRVLEAAETQGTSYARNVGIMAARGDLLAMCDADDCVGPRFIASAREGLEHADFVTGRVVPMQEDEFRQGREYLWELLDTQSSAEVAVDGVDPYYPILMGGACAMRRDRAIALGGFDQAYFPGAEDNDFALRVVAAGERIAHHPQMSLAERCRNTPSGAFRRSFDGGRMHIKLCAGHELWQVSPHLRNPRWWVDLLKLPLSALRLEASKPDAEQRRALASRTGLRLGQLTGMVEFKLLRQQVDPELGVGFQRVGVEGETRQ